MFIGVGKKNPAPSYESRYSTYKKTTSGISEATRRNHKVCYFWRWSGRLNGGKSWLGAEWLLWNCLKCPNTKWFIGRNELSRLMRSSYVTFQKVCNYHNLPRKLWKLNGQYNYIQFANGSRIDLLDLKYLPSDPLFERYGSSEYTGGWIEEAGEVNFLAFDVLKSRIGRQLNAKYDLLPPKLLITCNPKKNWLYQIIYKPWKESKLKKEYAFIQSLFGDNPYTKETYGEQLKEIKDEATRQRLQFGNWEYDDASNNLIDYDAILDLFTNTLESDQTKYLTSDIARFGKDKTTIGLWEGFKLYKIETIERSDLNIVETKIRDYLNKEHIPHSFAIADESGVGSGVVDNLRIKGFISNSSPLKDPITREKQNFKNLKSQCSYMLAEKINNREIAIDVMGDEKLRATIIEELEQLKAKDPDNDKKLEIVSKDEMKEKLGRSPDYLDMMIMRMWFELERPERRGSEAVSQHRPSYKRYKRNR